MKHLYTILTAIIAISLIACGKNKPGAQSPGAGSTANPGGTVDGGGGNS